MNISKVMKEFDKKFTWLIPDGGGIREMSEDNPENIKSFLTQKLTEQKEEVLEEVKHLYYNCEDGNGFHLEEFWEGLKQLSKQDKT